MGDSTTCEHCGREGNRRRGEVGPDGWYFGAFTFDKGGDHAPGDCLIVHVCSQECRDAVWTKQDGHKWDAIERRVIVPDEIRRYLWHVADRLRQDARKLRDGIYPDATPSDCRAAAIVARLLEANAGALLEEAESEIDALVTASGSAGVGGA